MRKFTVIKSRSFCFNPPSTHPGPAPKLVIMHWLMCIKLDWPPSVGLPSSRFLESSRNAPCVSLWWSSLHFCTVQKLQSHYRFPCWDLKLFITVGNTSENMWKRLSASCGTATTAQEYRCVIWYKEGAGGGGVIVREKWVGQCCQGLTKHVHTKVDAPPRSRLLVQKDTLFKTTNREIAYWTDPV